MAARTGRPYKLQVLSTNGERKLQGSANNPTTAFPGLPVMGLEVEEKLLALVKDIEKNRTQHIRMIGLLFPFPVAVIETRHNLTFLWFSSQEASMEVFHKGAFPTAWLSFDKEEVRALCRRPRKIALMFPKPLQRAFVLPQNLSVPCVVKTKAIQTHCNS